MNNTYRLLCSGVISGKEDKMRRLGEFEGKYEHCCLRHQPKHEPHRLFEQMRKEHPSAIFVSQRSPDVSPPFSTKYNLSLPHPPTNTHTHTMASTTGRPMNNNNINPSCCNQCESKRQWVRLLPSGLRSPVSSLPWVFPPWYRSP